MNEAVHADCAGRQGVSQAVGTVKSSMEAAKDIIDDMLTFLVGEAEQRKPVHP